MERNKKILVSLMLVALSVSIAVLVANSLPSVQKSTQIKGKIAGINIDLFTDSACTIPLTEVDFGIVYPNSVNTLTIYVKNTGNTAETLYFTTSDVIPVTGITCTWNRELYVLNGGSSVAAVITLNAGAVQPLIDFSLTGTITGVPVI